MTNKLYDLLCCPDTGEELELKEGELYSKERSYPIFNEVPWLYKNPEFYFLEWGTKIESYIKEEETYIYHLQKQINEQENKLTRKRIAAQHEARSNNLKVLSKRLDFFRGHQQIAIAASTQQIHSYFQNIFRDWSWETQENQIYFDFVQKEITNETKNVLILGAGAARISHDLASENTNINFYSIDHNPFLLLTAQSLFNGEENKMYDYTPYPKNLSETAQKHKIKIAKHEADNHLFILGRFPELPFKESSFDLIIAPWFFDILDTPFVESIHYTTKYLNDTGKLLIYGPQNVHKNELENQLCFEEIEEGLKEIFEQTHVESKTIEYLHNPITSQNRIEGVMFATCTKARTAAKELMSPTAPSTIYFTPTFEHHKNVNQTFFHIFKHIEDNMEIADLAKKLETEFGFKEDEALYYAQTFITKLQMEIY